VKFSFRLGKRLGWNRLSPEQKTIVEHLERGEISEDEAERLLGADVRVSELRLGNAATTEAASPPANEMEDKRKARELVEHIAREVDEETRR
jgi:hypothetical protein